MYWFWWCTCTTCTTSNVLPATSQKCWLIFPHTTGEQRGPLIMPEYRSKLCSSSSSCPPAIHMDKSRHNIAHVQNHQLILAKQQKFQHYKFLPNSFRSSNGSRTLIGNTQRIHQQQQRWCFSMGPHIAAAAWQFTVHTLCGHSVAWCLKKVQMTLHCRPASNNLMK